VDGLTPYVGEGGGERVAFGTALAGCVYGRSAFGLSFILEPDGYGAGVSAPRNGSVTILIKTRAWRRVDEVGDASLAE